MRRSFFLQPGKQSEEGTGIISMSVGIRLGLREESLGTSFTLRLASMSCRKPSGRIWRCQAFCSFFFFKFTETHKTVVYLATVSWNISMGT